jgi:hypothetical protein
MRMLNRSHSQTNKSTTLQNVTTVSISSKVEKNNGMLRKSTGAASL